MRVFLHPETLHTRGLNPSRRRRSLFPVTTTADTQWGQPNTPLNSYLAKREQQPALSRKQSERRLFKQLGSRPAGAAFMQQVGENMLALRQTPIGKNPDGTVQYAKDQWQLVFNRAPYPWQIINLSKHIITPSTGQIEPPLSAEQSLELFPFLKRMLSPRKAW